MQIESEQKIPPVTYIEALAALWCVKLRLGQYPVYLDVVPGAGARSEQLHPVAAETD